MLKEKTSMETPEQILMTEVATELARARSLGGALGG